MAHNQIRMVGKTLERVWFRDDDTGYKVQYLPAADCTGFTARVVTNCYSCNRLLALSHGCRKHCNKCCTCRRISHDDRTC